MNEDFNKWWNNDLLTEDNPFVDGTPAYWAWEGWCAKAALAKPDFWEGYVPEPVKPAQYSDIVSNGGLDPRNRFDQPAQQEPVAFPTRRAVEREIERISNPTGMHLNDAKERVTLPGGTLRFMLALIDRTSPPAQQEPDVDRLIALARADEREACAKVCDDLPAPESCSMAESSLWDVATLECGDAIRARSNT